MLTPQNLPWRVVSTDYEQNMGRNAKVVIVDCTGNHVATCGWPGAPKSADIQNAASIVACANLYQRPV